MKLFSKLSSVGGIFGKISGAWAAGAPQVKFDADHGSFIVEVYPDKVPRTAANFLEYVKTGQYAGTIAMARTDDPNSARAQCFTNVIDNPSLNLADRNPDYAVFGKVISGMDVVDRIKAVPTTSHGYFSNVPATPIIIKSATLLSN
ncbi:MAG: peptidylprolyl isomerase [Candidatus Protistobacter heckmanni]|nr:peptidylprolyl isomerase [Candidatus Protistobacter heckmanni]